MRSSTAPYFTSRTLSFLRSLARHNERDWFQGHRGQYEEHGRGPSLQLIADLAAPLARISTVLVADPRPVGGSLFRIHRDTRFSSDKRPYKTHLGITFYHRATRQAARGLAGNAALGRLDAPVVYLHVEPAACFIAGGIWHPQPATLKRLRDFMVDNPRSWSRLKQARGFRAHFALGGDSLVRPPRGYPADHPLLEDLKRKDLIASTDLSDAQITSAQLPKLVIERVKQLRPLLEWQCLALELDF